MPEECKYFTVVFKGDIRAISGNPFKIVSQFGEPITIGLGDCFEENDRLIQELDGLENAP